MFISWVGTTYFYYWNLHIQNGIQNGHVTFQTAHFCTCSHEFSKSHFSHVSLLWSPLTLHNSLHSSFTHSRLWNFSSFTHSRWLPNGCSSRACDPQASVLIVWISFLICVYAGVCQEKYQIMAHVHIADDQWPPTWLILKLSAQHTSDLTVSQTL